ncbi:MAG: L,D-transpeptidase family protein [Eubacterium sp.]|nr:L,D-transpeptidase family protein [Eubacterium sp.]
MSKNSKSRSNRNKKKRSKSKTGSSRSRNARSEQKKIEQLKPAVPEQLNNDTHEDQIDTPEDQVDAAAAEAAPLSAGEVPDQSEQTEVQVKVYQPEPEDSVSSDEEIQEKHVIPAPVIPEALETADKDEISRELEEYTQNINNSIKPEKPQQVKKPKKKKRNTGFKVATVLILLLIYCAAVIYGFFWIDDNIIDPDRYPNGTTLNGIDVSGMDIDEAKQALTDDWNTHSISIFDAGGKEIGEIGDFDFKYDIDEQLEHALSPGAETALSRFVQKKKDDIPVRMDPAGNTKNFKRQFGQLSIVKEAKGDKPSKNAYIDKSDTEFRIVKEVIGNSVDTRLLRKAIFRSIAEGDEVFEFRRSDYHLLPEIVSTSQELLDERDYCIKNLSFTIRLRNPVNDYTIPPSWLDKMMTVSDKGKVTLNDEQISQFISEVVYPKFSSVGDTRRLKSAGGGHYTISGGTYGYVIDVEKEHQMLTADLKERDNVEREPYYAGKAPGDNWKNDIGNDFIEVSIAKQTCWVVRHGKVVVETPVVTGVLPRHATPQGVFYIVYKATHVTLKGRNDDGSKYESKVTYWMPFYLGFGLHDASWRGYFGGSIYVNNGSHGCVNCPPSVMPKIFSNSYEGMPVIVH